MNVEVTNNRHLVWFRAPKAHNLLYSTFYSGCLTVCKEEAFPCCQHRVLLPQATLKQSHQEQFFPLRIESPVPGTTFLAWKHDFVWSPRSWFFSFHGGEDEIPPDFPTCLRGTKVLTSSPLHTCWHGKHWFGDMMCGVEYFTYTLGASSENFCGKAIAVRAGL